MRGIMIRSMRAGVVLPLLLAVMAASSLLHPTAASPVNYCPGSPWTCNWLTSCNDITWCVAKDPSQNWCNAWLGQQNYGWYKHVIIKKCTDGCSTVYCSSCGCETQQGCCIDITAEPACPNEGACN